MIENSKGKAAKRYQALTGDREPYLSRARECSSLTIPSLLPPEGHTGGSLAIPYDGIGARAVNTLAAKLLLSLLPPAARFFRLSIDESVLEEAANGSNDTAELRTQVDEALRKMETRIAQTIEKVSDRSALFEAFKHLIAAGNVLLMVHKTGLRVFHLSNYVCVRDAKGKVIELVILENVARAALDDDILELLKLNPTGTAEDNAKTVKVYTHVRLIKGKYRAYQHVSGLLIPGSEATYTEDNTPYLALRWNRIDGEGYGRGHVEDSLGDFRSLDELSGSIVRGSGAAARLIFLVNPNGAGMTRPEDLEAAEDGAFVPGRVEDVAALQAGKFGDFRTAREEKGGIKEQIAQAFMMRDGVVRDAERVTLGEVRYLAQELEDTLGGIYSLLAEEFQLPYLSRRMGLMRLAGKLPRVPAGLVHPTIVSGMDALGRTHELARLDSLIERVTAVVGAEGIAQRLDMDEYISRVATAEGVDAEGLFLTQDQIDGKTQQNQLQAIAAQAGGDAASTAATSLAEQAAAPQPQPE